MFLKIVIVDIIDIHVFDIPHEIGLLSLLIRFGLHVVISLDKNSPASADVNLFSFILSSRLLLLLRGLFIRTLLMLDGAFCL